MIVLLDKYILGKNKHMSANFSYLKNRVLKATEYLFVGYIEMYMYSVAYFFLIHVETPHAHIITR